MPRFADVARALAGGARNRAVLGPNGDRARIPRGEESGGWSQWVRGPSKITSELKLRRRPDGAGVQPAMEGRRAPDRKVRRSFKRSYTGGRHAEWRDARCLLSEALAYRQR